MADVGLRSRSEEGVNKNYLIKPTAAKRPRIKQTFRSAYCLEWPIIRKSALGIYHALCTVYRLTSALSTAEKSDITKHVTTYKHQNQATLSDIKKSTRLFFW